MADKEKKEEASGADDKKKSDKKDKKTDKKDGGEESDGEGGENPVSEKGIAALLKNKMVLIGIAVGVLVLGGGIGAYFMMSGDDEPAVEEAHATEGQSEPGAAATTSSKDKALYIDIRPEFVINIQDSTGQTSFLQIGVSIMARKEDAIDAIKKHMVLIKNNLVNLFIDRNYHELMTVEGKESLRAEALEEIRQILKEQEGVTGVESVYFTSFVLQ